MSLSGRVLTGAARAPRSSTTAMLLSGVQNSNSLSITLLGIHLLVPWQITLLECLEVKMQFARTGSTSSGTWSLLATCCSAQPHHAGYAHRTTHASVTMGTSPMLHGACEWFPGAEMRAPSTSALVHRITRPACMHPNTQDHARNAMC